MKSFFVMSRLRYQVETSIRDVVLLLHRSEVPSAIIESVRQRLVKLITICIEMDAEVKEAEKPDPELFCRQLVYEIVDSVSTSIAPQRQLERNERWNYDLHTELSKAKAQLQEATAECTLHKTHLNHVRAAHQYTLQSYFREVHMLRKRNLAVLGDELHNVNHEAVFDYRKYLNTMLDDSLDVQLGFVNLQEKHQDALRSIDGLNLQIANLEFDLSTVQKRAEAASREKLDAVRGSVSGFGNSVSDRIAKTHEEIRSIREQMVKFQEDGNTLIESLSTALGGVTLSNRILVDFMLKVCEYITSLADGDYAMTRAIERRRMQEVTRKQQEEASPPGKGVKWSPKKPLAGVSRKGQTTSIVDPVLTSLDSITPTALATEYIDFTRKAFQTALQIDPDTDTEMVRKIKLMWRQSSVSSKAIEAVVGCRKVFTKHTFAQEQISKIGAMLARNDPLSGVMARGFSVAGYEGDATWQPLRPSVAPPHGGASIADSGRTVTVPTKTFNVVFRDVTNVFRSHSGSFNEQASSDSGLASEKLAAAAVPAKPVAALPEPATLKNDAGPSGLRYAQALRFVIDNSGGERISPDAPLPKTSLGRLVLWLLFSLAGDPCEENLPEHDVERIVSAKGNHQQLNGARIALAFARAADRKRSDRIQQWCVENKGDGGSKYKSLITETYQTKAKEAFLDREASSREKSHLLFLAINENTALLLSEISKATILRALTAPIAKAFPVEVSNIIDGLWGNSPFQHTHDHSAHPQPTGSAEGKTRVGVGFVGVPPSAGIGAGRSRFRKAVATIQAASMFLKASGLAPLSQASFSNDDSCRDSRAASIMQRSGSQTQVHRSSTSASTQLPNTGTEAPSSHRPSTLSISDDDSEKSIIHMRKSTDVAVLPRSKTSGAKKSADFRVSPRDRLSPVRNRTPPGSGRNTSAASDTGYNLVLGTPYSTPSHLLNNRGRSPLKMSLRCMEIPEAIAQYDEFGSLKEPPAKPYNRSSPLRSRSTLEHEGGDGVWDTDGFEQPRTSSSMKSSKILKSFTGSPRGGGTRVAAVHLSSLRRQQQLLSQALEGCILQDPRVRDLLFRFHATIPESKEYFGGGSKSADSPVEIPTSGSPVMYDHPLSVYATDDAALSVSPAIYDVPVHTVAERTAELLLRHLETTFGCQIPLDDVVLDESNVLSLIIDSLINHHERVGDKQPTTQTVSKPGKRVGSASTRNPPVVNVHLEAAAAAKATSTTPRILKGAPRSSTHQSQDTEISKSITAPTPDGSGHNGAYDTDLLRVQAMEYPRQITIPGRHTILNNADLSNKSLVMITMARLLKAGHGLGPHGGLGSGVGSGWSGSILGSGSFDVVVNHSYKVPPSVIPATGAAASTTSGDVRVTNTSSPTHEDSASHQALPLDDVAPPAKTGMVDNNASTGSGAVTIPTADPRRPETAPAHLLPRPPSTAGSTPSAADFSQRVSARRRVASNAAVTHDFNAGCAPICVGFAATRLTTTPNLSRPPSSSMNTPERPGTAAAALERRTSVDSSSVPDKRSNPNYTATASKPSSTPRATTKRS